MDRSLRKGGARGDFIPIGEGMGLEGEFSSPGRGGGGISLRERTIIICGIFAEQFRNGYFLVPC
jgi:hypothetical protein